MRRVLAVATVVGFLLLGSGLVWGALPAWVDSGDIRDGDNALKVQSDSIPTCVDWNNDGAIDLVVGQYSYGNIWLYLNQGTNANPIFNGGTKIESAGTPITTSYGWCIGSSPRVVDWNNDGRKDLLTGENNGNIRIYLNTGTDPSPVFNGYTLVKLGAANFDAGSYSSPHVVDWNNDGMKDLLCGESGGRIWLLVNRNTDADPEFTSATYIQDGAAALDAGGVTCPTVADLDGDGKKDLLIGETYGQLHFYSNVGTDANPAFNGKVIIQEDEALFDVGYYSRPDMVDFNQDGTLDIVCGTSQGLVAVLKAVGPFFVSKNGFKARDGGVVDLLIDAGLAQANRDYFILGSVTGTTPGIPLGSVTLPLNWDGFSDLVVAMANSPAMTNFSGTLNAKGMAKAELNTLGSVPATAVGITMYFAHILYYPIDYVSIPLSVEIMP